MTQDFNVKVVHVVSDQVAHVWRAPDQHHREGRAYGLRLSRVVDKDGNPSQVKEGDIVSVSVDEAAPDKIILARLLEHVTAPAHEPAYA